MTDDTLLVISGAGIPQWSARGLSQQFQPIDEATQLERDCNANLVDLSVAAFRKWQTTITCSDMRTPVFDAVWPGAGPFTVDCVAEFVFVTGHTRQRTAVPNSDRIEGANTFYRPRLTMLVKSFNFTRDEYGGVVGWQLVLEEA